MSAEFDSADPAAQAVSSPTLSADQLRRLIAYGTPEDVEVGAFLSRAGDARYDLVVVETATVEVIRPATLDAPEEVVIRHGPGRFVGELNLLTGQILFLSARVAKAGRIHRVSPQRFRRLMAQDAELSDLLLRALLARRELLREGTAARSLEIVGSSMSSPSLALRTFAARRELPHRWLDADSEEGQALMRIIPASADELPVVVMPGRIMRRTTPGELAVQLGLSYRRAADNPVDLTVVGAGPAGLAAAVYGASEGLATVLLDAFGPGGQAANSARIENYLGFPSGLSGAELTSRATTQALKFGAELSSPCEIVELDCSEEHLRVVLKDGTDIASRAVIIATGARYRALPLDRWDEFAGAGIYFAATELEARVCSGEPVTVVGGANSAGQAALYLASRRCTVTIAIRGADITKDMSYYLVDRLQAEPRVTIRTETEVTALDGERALRTITLSDRAAGAAAAQPCHGLFCFIGAEPATDWVSRVVLDEHGFVRTDAQLDAAHLGDMWSTLGRAPLPFETSVPGVFAVGDVRLGSMKRVAAAVGEGASAVRSVHAAIGARA